jgi:hypothetical protein
VAVAFKWHEWNLDHATRHGCAVEEIESVVRNPARGYPRHSGEGKLLAIGRGQGGRLIRVVYVIEDSGPVFVIHAMPLTTRRRKRGR